jgi:hypothetical protein
MNEPHVARIYRTEPPFSGRPKLNTRRRLTKCPRCEEPVDPRWWHLHRDKCPAKRGLKDDE